MARCSGFTLIEVLVATAILVVCIGLAMGTLLESQNVACLTMTQAQVESIARGVAGAIQVDLRNSGASVIEFPRGAPSAAAPAPEVIFPVAEGFDAGSVAWSADYVRYYERAHPGEIPGNGLDDEGDGIADDYEIVHEIGTWTGGAFTPAMSRVVLSPAGGLPPMGAGTSRGLLLVPLADGRIALTVRAVRRAPDDAPGEASVEAVVAVELMPRN